MFRRAAPGPTSGTHKDIYEYHFVNVPKSEATFDLSRDCRAIDCAVVGIQRFARYLAEDAQGSRERERKALALRFLAHFVGDMHQPLHVGFAEDLGGNRIDVRWKRSATGSFISTDLHKVWDGEILDRAGPTQDDAADLNGEITPAEANQWENFEIAAWAAESYGLARTRAYSHPNGDEVSDGDELGNDYFNAALPVVKEQLKKAGARLAHLINAAAAGTLPTNMIEFKP